MALESESQPSFVLGWTRDTRRLSKKEFLHWLVVDPRWAVAFVLLGYLVLGMTILGFNRTPMQITVTTLSAMLLEMGFSFAFTRKVYFPLSSMITSFGLSILLNYSHSFGVLLLPVYFAIAGKYVFTIKNRHIYNPGLFGIVLSLILSESLITASPAYQWNGITAMSALIVMPALFLFMPRIGRTTIVISFLTVFTIQTALRAWIMKHHLPFETLFFGTLSSPSFFLFVFFMITDPATSPPSRKQQIWAGAIIATLDLAFHLGQSYFTFFYAAFVFATFRSLWSHLNLFKSSSLGARNYLKSKFWTSGYYKRPLVLVPLGYFLMVTLIPDTDAMAHKQSTDFKLTEHIAQEAGIEAHLGDLYNEVDPRVQHVIKWIFSVGDSVAVGDYDNDGFEDIFLTLVLKEKEQRLALYRNLGDFKFERVPLPALDHMRHAPKENGVGTTGVFADYDNDGDQDLFITVAFGHPVLLQNQLTETGIPSFLDVSEEAGLAELYTNSITATFSDFNLDGHLDLFIGNVLPEYLPDYDSPTRLNLFDLPDPEYDGDRRMFHFMHYSWHEANNGGRNLILMSNGDGTFERKDSLKIGLDPTRWTLAVAATDLNEDSWPDLYIANDFGADTVLMNRKGTSFEKVEGKIFGSIGRDTYKGMNASAGDVDRNGKMDIYVSNVHHHLQAEGSMLWLNKTAEHADRVDLSDQATFLGALNPRRFGWGAAMVDLDHNGWLDIIQANGMVDDTIDKRWDDCPDYWYVNEKIARSPPSYHAYADKWGDIRGMCIYGHERNRIYLNRGNAARPQFVDVAVKVGAGKKSTSRGVAAVDFNNNGRSDLVITHMFHPPSLYENVSENEGQIKWLGLKFEGSGQERCNRDAIGTRVRIKNNNSLQQVHEVQTVSGFMAQGSRRHVFGMGQTNLRFVDIEVLWCGKGAWQEFANLELNTYHKLNQ